MALADIRTALAAAIAEVENVGKVNAYDVLANREEDFRAFFFDAALGYVLGWAITREMTTETDKDTESNWSTHLMVIRGYRVYGFATAGATEMEFQDLVEAVRARLRVEQRAQLGGSATIVGPPAVRILEPRMFGGGGGNYLVHYVEIILTVRESVLVG